MKIELEELESQDGVLLKLGSIYTRFNSRAEAEQFLELLRGRVDAVKFNYVSDVSFSEPDHLSFKSVDPD